MGRLFPFVSSPVAAICSVLAFLIVVGLWQSHSSKTAVEGSRLEVTGEGRQPQRQTKTYRRDGKETGPLYSTHNCVGTSFHGGLEQEKTRCHFKNVCLTLAQEVYSPDPSLRESSVNLTYYRPPSAIDAPYYWNNEFDGNSWVRIGRSSELYPEFVYEPIDEGKRWSEAETTVLTEAFWPENFGHALGDDYFPVFRLAKSFSSWNGSELQVIFHPGCDKKGNSARGCSHHDEISSLLLTRKVDLNSSPFWLSSGNAEDDNEADDDGDDDGDENEHERRNINVEREICFKNLLVGTREFGMAYPSENSWPEFVEEMRTNAGGTLNKVAITKQKVLMFIKKGRRTLLNYEAVKRHLENRFGLDEVELWDPSKFTLVEQIQKLETATVIVTPPGGVSFSAMFLPRGSSAVFVDFWDMKYQQSVQMERHIFTYQSNITPFYYPVTFDEVVVDNSQVPKDVLESGDKWLIWRDFADVKIDLKRMETYVLAGLIQAEVSHALKDSFIK